MSLPRAVPIRPKDGTATAARIFVSPPPFSYDIPPWQNDNSLHPKSLTLPTSSAPSQTSNAVWTASFTFVGIEGPAQTPVDRLRHATFELAGRDLASRMEDVPPLLEQMERLQGLAAAATRAHRGARRSESAVLRAHGAARRRENAGGSHWAHHVRRLTGRRTHRRLA